MRAGAMNCRKNKLSRIASLALLVWLGITSSPYCLADTVGSFALTNGSPTAAFEWDNFSGDYWADHASDIEAFGGSAFLIPSVDGGLVTTTSNLYTFFTPSTDIQFSLNGLDASNPFSTVVLQFATPSTLTSGDFTLDGATPDDFQLLGLGADSGFGPYQLYWAEWQALAASDAFQLTVGSFGQHASIGGARALVFNTSTPFDAAAVPEPAFILWTGPLLALQMSRRRRQS